MKILFVCNICEEKRHQIPDGYQAAAMLWQKKILAGFEQLPGVEVDILSSPLIPSFSFSYKKLISKGYSWSHISGANDYCVSFLNVFPIRNLFMQSAFKRYIKKWIKKQAEDEELCIISYSPRIPFIESGRQAKKYGIKSCAIIPDLPEYAGISRMGNPLYRFMKRFDVKSFYKKAKDIDGFVLFSKYMSEKFPYEIKSTVVECICSDKTEEVEDEFAKDNFKRIVYTGGIESSYGLDLLLQAFSKINSTEYRLDICGSGSYENDVILAAESDTRIKFHGLLSHEKVLKIQKQASILVNPRPSNGVFTRYSFPSKTAEYMMAGKPVLCFKLEGIPDEYDEYLYYFSSQNPEYMAKDLERCCNLQKEELEKLRDAEIKFLLSQKTCAKQAKHILDFINEK